MTLESIKKLIYENGLVDSGAEGFSLGDLFDDEERSPIVKHFGLTFDSTPTEEYCWKITFPDGVEINDLVMFGEENGDLDSEEMNFDLFHVFGNAELNRWLGVYAPFELSGEIGNEAFQYFSNEKELLAIIKSR
jgi:hypothetical protein